MGICISILTVQLPELTVYAKLSNCRDQAVTGDSKCRNKSLNDYTLHENAMACMTKEAVHYIITKCAIDIHWHS